MRRSTFGLFAPFLAAGLVLSLFAVFGAVGMAQAPPDPEPAPSVDALLAAAVVSLQDARTGAQTGQADVDVAMARARDRRSRARRGRSARGRCGRRAGRLPRERRREHRCAHGCADGDARRARAATAAGRVGVESKRAGGGGNPRPRFFRHAPQEGAQQ